MSRRFLISSVSLVILSAACEDKPKEQPTTTTTAQPPALKAAASALSTPSASASSATVAAKEPALPAGATRFVLFMGKGSFLIDAPLEKIKGRSDEVTGHLDVDPKDISKTRGEILVRLSTLKTNTFGEMDKDAAQTEHARNWME